MSPDLSETAPPLVRVKVEGVTKRYGRHTALHPCSLELARGRPCVVVGENGAGKSTLLAVVAGAIAPDRGTVRYEADGHAVTGVELRRRIGWVTHVPMAYRELTVAENVAFFARLGGVGDPRAATVAVLDRLGLGPLADRVSGELSRGNQARLGLARALVTGPELLVLDEAAAGLDAAGRGLLEGWLAEEAERRLLLVATHDGALMARLAAQIVVLRRGRVVEDRDVTALGAEARARLAAEVLGGTEG